jgi:HPt (histidine-containing phosphotransfer) domain-containing protein
MDQGATDRPDSGPQVLDEATLDSLAEQLGEDIDGLVVRFRRRLGETGPMIEAALVADDRFEISRQAHSLKSVAATFGAAAVARSSAALEADAGGADPAVLTAAVERLSRECAAAAAAVGDWLSARGT